MRKDEDDYLTVCSSGGGGEIKGDAVVAGTVEENSKTNDENGELESYTNLHELERLNKTWRSPVPLMNAIGYNQYRVTVVVRPCRRNGRK